VTAETGTHKEFTMSQHTASVQLEQRLQTQVTFQFSVDSLDLEQGLHAANAAANAGIDILEMGTPLLKFEGVNRVVRTFRQHFPQALLLADMKTMDGGSKEAEAVFANGANIIDFLALAGSDTARALCQVRDKYRNADEATPRLVFADLLLPHHGDHAVDVARRMLDAGVDGVGVHLQADARTADPALFQSGLLADTARAIYEAVGDRASVQIVGGLTIQQACALAERGLRAFVISTNLGTTDTRVGLHLPQNQIQQHIEFFMQQVRQSASGETSSG
jgi:3-keto-L-gulonate-6-phosphate decarboxylase